MSITPAQCRAARALLDIRQSRLAEMSGVAERTIASFENGQRAPREKNLAALRVALETAGVAFTTHGVALEPASRAD